MKRRLTRFFLLFGWVFYKAVQALPGTPAVGDVFTFVMFDIGNGGVILVQNTGITIVNSNTLFWNRIDTRIVTCRVTNVTAGSEAISIY